MNKKISRFIFVLSFIFLFIGSFLYENTAQAEGTLVNAKLTPVITSIRPTSAKVGDVITINGENFQRLDYIVFNNTKTIAESFDDKTGKFIKVKVPAGATDGKITVMNFSNLSTVSSDIFRIITSDYIVFDYDIKTVTMNSVSLKASGLMSSEGYLLSLYDSGATTPFKTLTLNSASDGTFQFEVKGLTAGHTYDAALDLNYDGSITHRKISFDTLADPNTIVSKQNNVKTPPDPSASTTKTKEKSIYTGIVPECNTGEIDKETGQYKNACDFNYFMELINKLIKFLLFTIATPLVALILMYTGYLYITAGGSAGQTEKAKHIIFSAVVGYIIALAAWLIINTIVTSLLPKDTDINTYLDKSSLQK